MNKKILWPTIFFIFIFALAIFALSYKNQPLGNQAVQSLENQEASPAEDSIILFYGDGCSHCVLVSRYIQDNGVQDKISFVQKEISQKNNYQELMEKARICDPSASSVGIPFLWDGEKCIIGDTNIINFFQEKIDGE